MKFNTHETDLYVLPESVGEKNKVVNFLDGNKLGWEWSYSNVGGQEWHGKYFIEIPFGCRLKKEIEKL